MKSLKIWAVGWMLLAVGLLPPLAQAAAFATGGTGLYRDQILWLTWGGGVNGTNGVNLSAGGSTSATVPIGNQNLEVTCNLGERVNEAGAGQLNSYRPGNWRGDTLDDLYNIGGVGVANQLIAGLANSQSGLGERMRFTITCNATLGGAPYDLPGIVFADAEQSASGGTMEFVQGTADGVWHVTERAATDACVGQAYNGTLTQAGTVQTLRLSVPGACGGQGPIAVGFLTFNPTAYSGASRQITTTFTIQGEGASAIAIGILAPYGDSGDAPASYGSIFHLYPPSLTADGLTVGATTNVMAGGFTLSNFGNPTTNRLGSLLDPNAPSLPGNAAANADDTNSGDDEDAVNVAGLPVLLPGNQGQSFTVPVSCAGTGSVRAWIDFNRDGDFLDTDEASTTVTCSANAANLAFTIPAGTEAGVSYLRVSYALLASDLSAPSGVRASGEVEDHALTIAAQPQVVLRKTTLGVAGSGFGFALTNTTQTTGSVTTTQANTPTAVDGDTGVAGTQSFTVTTASQTVTINENTIPAGWELTSATCTDAGGATVGSLSDTTYTLPASATGANAVVTCTFTSSRLPILRLGKALPLGRFVASDQFNLSIAATATTTVTTSGTGSVVNGTASVNPGVIGQAYTLSEAGASGADLNNYSTSHACTNALPGGQAPSGSGARSFSITPVAGDDITCTFTNTLISLVNLSISKDNGVTTLETGSTTTYTIVVNNAGPNAADGTTLQDPVAPGLSCTTSAVCAASGGAACPGGAVNAAGVDVPAASLQAGVLIATLPAGGSLSVQLVCSVTASGV